MQAKPFHPKLMRALRACAGLTLLLLWINAAAQDKDAPALKRERAAVLPSATMAGGKPKAAAASPPHKAVTTTELKAGAASHVKSGAPDRPGGAAAERGAAPIANPDNLRTTPAVPMVVPQRSHEFSTSATSVPVAPDTAAASQPEASAMADDARLRQWALPAASAFEAAASAAATQPVKRSTGVVLSAAVQRESAVA
jgi:hypothetical protein